MFAVLQYTLYLIKIFLENDYLKKINRSMNFRKASEYVKTFQYLKYSERFYRCN